MPHPPPTPRLLHKDQTIINGGTRGTDESAFRFSRTRGSVCPSTLSLSTPSKQETPHSYKNALLAYL